MTAVWKTAHIGTRTLFVALAVTLSAPMAAAAPEESAAAIDRAYGTTIQPLLRRFCYDCHANDLTEAEIDFAAFKTTADVRRGVKTWLKVRAMLDSGQMPPKDATQPTDAERKQLQSWVRSFLTAEAKAHAGDPGPIVLRRLNNAEYNYTIRDLTSVPTLDPTREFPVDGAAGEGFTNTGSAQSMSPSLVSKYLDAAKRVAGHVVLLPDGIRFSPSTTQRDQTNELLAQIRGFYLPFTEDSNANTVQQQGITLPVGQGGRLPVARYIAATIAERDAIRNGRKTLNAVARERSLNEKYLQTLWKTLNTAPARQSLLIDGLRRQWQQAEPTDVPKLVAEIEAAQNSLWKFNSIGHIGREGGVKSWMEAVTPLTTRQTLRQKLPATADNGEIVIWLSAADLGDGHSSDFFVLERPRIEFTNAKGEETGPPIELRGVRSLVPRIEATLAKESARTTQYLAAVAGLRTSKASSSEVAAEKKLNPLLLQQWSQLVGLGSQAKREIVGHYKTKLKKVHGYDAVNGWGTGTSASLYTNRSEAPVTFLTLTVPARGVAVHPWPELESLVAWRSPADMTVRIEGLVADADAVCGNGAAWRVSLQTATGTTILASGVYDNGKRQTFKPADEVSLRKDDIISLIVSARDRNHACDTTHVDLKIAETAGKKRLWNLAADVVDRVLESNPLPDSYGNADTWHFGALNDNGQAPDLKSQILPGSSLARWRDAVTDKKPADEVNQLALAVQNTFTATNDAQLDETERKLRTQLRDGRGPLNWILCSRNTPADSTDEFGIDPAQFGKHPNGSPLPETHLCLQAPQLIPIRLPASLVAGAEFVTSAVLHAKTAAQGTVQLQLTSTKPSQSILSLSTPILVGQAAQKRIEAAMHDFRKLFPEALCYARIVPVDEVVTLRLFYREDDHLQRLMLNDKQREQLDRLWDELFYVAHEPLKLAVSFEQLYEFATQDRPDLVKAFEPMRKPINERADRFRNRLVKTEPAHVDALIEFAGRAWRRPLTTAEVSALRGLYHTLRREEIAHDEAVRLTLARILTSPDFLYRSEHPAAGKEAAPVSNVELATRLCYFLWSSLPDAELRRAAETGTLATDAELTRQTRRMLQHPHVRRLAIQFACQWLHLRGFDRNDDKNEKLYPEFAARRSDMYEETVRFFEDMFRNDGSILNLLNANHTFLNESLAKHYGIANVTGPEWRRVDGVQTHGRGGILAMATLLASQSGASRTSPILRGNWIYETLLGERLPRPPANVPQLPEAVPTGLTARQLIEKHSSVAACAKCHVLIDPYGFALEQYDAIGRLRNSPADTKTTLVDGQKIEGIDGLRNYLMKDRQQDVVRQFCRKLLGYSLGREVQLSDELLLAEMQRKLEANDYRFSAAVETIVTSQQFRSIRGRDFIDE